MGIQVEAQVKFQPVDGQTLTHVFNDGSSGPGGAVAAGLVIMGKVRGSVAAEPNGRWVIKMLLIRMENKEKLARKIQRSFF